MNRLDHAEDDLAYVISAWPDMCVMRLAGTPLPWSARRLSDDERHASVQRDRDERADRNLEAPGYTAAPLRVTVLDALVDIEGALLGLQWQVLDALAAPREGRRQTMAVPELAAWLIAARPVIEGDGRLAARCVAESRRAASIARVTLRDVPSRLPLTNAGCISCGCERLTLHNGNNPTQDGFVTCDNPHCDPSSKECGNWWKGRPCWPLHELEWLAERIVAQ